MTKFLVKGDLHNLWNEFIAELKGKDHEFAICVGDNGIYPDLSALEIVDPPTIVKFEGEALVEFNDQIEMPIPVFTVPGNHEDQEFLDDSYTDDGIFYAAKNLTVIHGTIIQIKPYLYLAGIGKIFVENTYNNFPFDTLEMYGRKNGRKLVKSFIKRRNHNTKEEITLFFRRLKQFNSIRTDKDKLIWVSHDAPKYWDTRRGIWQGSDMVTDLIREATPDFAFFGHYHNDYQFNETEHILGKYQLKEFSI